MATTCPYCQGELVAREIQVIAASKAAVAVRCAACAAWVGPLDADSQAACPRCGALMRLVAGFHRCPSCGFKESCCF